jgi:murein DD-endopeptidase MepM/ murein hydrolase activator NlpD
MHFVRRAVSAFGSIALVALVAWSLAGDHIRSIWTELMQPRSPHARYAAKLRAAGLDETAVGQQWLTSASTVLRAPRRMSVPFSVDVAFDESRPAAAAWTFASSRGRRLELEIVGSGRGELFVDLFALRDDAPRLIASVRERESKLTFDVVRDEWFVLRVQPELLAGSRISVRQRAVATLRFPVAGTNARSVQSVFGDVRDRGVRSHEGVDIFAPRGTPVLAASDGWITRVTTNRLGGKVVWQWDPSRGQALYYAHLDHQEVRPGTRVRPGDTIGRVGNTGNAATTSPHLHFGIYRAVEGAVDPLPFICDAPCGRRGMAYAQPR